MLLEVSTMTDPGCRSPEEAERILITDQVTSVYIVTGAVTWTQHRHTGLQGRNIIALPYLCCMQYV